MSIYDRLAKAYKVACPIVSLASSDPAQAIRSIVTALPDCNVINWDCAVGATVPAQSDIDAATRAATEIEGMINLTDALVSASKLPAKSVLIIQNAHRFLDREDVVQAIWNLRDKFKAPKRMLILMGTSIRLPVEIQNDVIELDEPLPTQAELEIVVRNVAASASIELQSQQASDSAAASQGLSAFAAEQLAALNLSRADGVSVQGVWNDKCSKINETPGLRVVSAGSFADVAGVENAKSFLSGILGGNGKPNTIVFVDEIEKALGGSGSDSSGVSQDQLGVLLQWMQDKRAAGCIFVGPAGAAKSALAKAAGGEAAIPTIQLDLGGMKGSLVGESETRIRDALKVIDSVSGGNTLWLATCNSMVNLPPELRRRFKFGTFFFDLPDRQERIAIWTLYCQRYGFEMPGESILNQEWTGAEIESACEIAYRIDGTIEQAAEYIVPISRSSAPQIEALREAANGRFLSASNKGVYARIKATEAQATRQID